MEETFEENDMGAVNLARAGYRNQRKVDVITYQRSPRHSSSICRNSRRSQRKRSKSRKHYQSDDVSSLEDDLASMSLCIPNVESRRSHRRSQDEKTRSHHSETESQYRTRTRGTQRSARQWGTDSDRKSRNFIDERIN